MWVTEAHLSQSRRCFGKLQINLSFIAHLLGTFYWLMPYGLWKNDNIISLEKLAVKQGRWVSYNSLMVLLDERSVGKCGADCPHASEGCCKTLVGPRTSLLRLYPDSSVGYQRFVPQSPAVRRQSVF